MGKGGKGIEGGGGERGGSMGEGKGGVGGMGEEGGGLRTGDGEMKTVCNKCGDTSTIQREGNGCHSCLIGIMIATK